MTHGQKRAKELVTTRPCPNATGMYGLYIEGGFIGFTATPTLIEERATALQTILAREIDAARKNTRRKSK